jgi:uncharacterized delta-60 repeat protein
MNRLPAIPTLALLGIALVAPPVCAIDGTLDLTLQGTGTFNGLVPTLAGAVALTFDPEGRPVMGYTRLWSGTDRDLQIAVVHDQGPAGGCNVSIDLGGTNQDHLLALARTNESVYLVGKAAGPAINPKDQLVIARLNPTSCALDPQFDGDGKLIIPYANPLVGRALSVEPDGRLRAAVEMRTSVGGPARLLSLGLHANGSGDGTFGTQIVSFSPAYAATEFVPTAMARQPDGKVVVVGAVYLNDGDVDVGVVRFHTNGGLDTSFSGDGLASFAFEIVDVGVDHPTAVAILADGRIAIAGTLVKTSSDKRAAVAILTPTGGYDNGFGLIGRYTFDYAQLGESTGAAMAEAGNRLVVVGYARTAALNVDFGVARLLTSGSNPLDPSFGTGGKTTIAFDLGNFNSDFAQSVAIDPHGRIVVGGAANDGTADYPVIARLESSYIFADGFERFGTGAWSTP